MKCVYFIQIAAYTHQTKVLLISTTLHSDPTTKLYFRVFLFCIEVCSFVISFNSTYSKIMLKWAVQKSSWRKPNGYVRLQNHCTYLRKYGYI